MLRCFSILGFVALQAHSAEALELTMPSSGRLTLSEDLGVNSYAIPIAPFDGTLVPSRTFEGLMVKQSWKIEGDGDTPLQVLGPLRGELKKAGYTTVFECSDWNCGGFDFRFGTEIISAPEMVIDLDNFRFLSAMKGPAAAPEAAVSLLVSRNKSASYVQIIQVSVKDKLGVTVSKSNETPAVQTSQNAGEALGFIKQLEISGHVILRDLTFKTGSSELGDDPFASLEKIAAYLKANPQRKIALVGHTDAVGGLDGNIALSKRRASSVVQRLISDYNVPADQLSSDGVGFLAPVSSNLTLEGRNANRRVEAIMISTK